MYGCVVLAWLGCGGDSGSADVALTPCFDGGGPAGDGAGNAQNGGAAGADAGGGIDGHAGPADGGAADVAPQDTRPLLPGTVSIRIVHDTEADFKLPELRFRVGVVGMPDITADVGIAGGKYEVTMVIPAGPQQLRLTERSPSGEDNIDYFQNATRTIAVDVPSADNIAAEFHLKWHWEPRQVRGTDSTPSCRGPAQLQFRDAQHGVMTLAQESTSVANYPHGAALVTDDGGQTWTVSSELMIPSPDHWFRPGAGNWWNNHHLLLQPDGVTVLSLGDNDTIARSGDGGKTWGLVPFSPPTWGPGNVTFGGIARSGPYIFVAADTGGVQGSRQRTSISRSLDGGKTFQVMLDRCEGDSPGDSCSSAHTPLPLGFAGIDLGCGPEGHCVSLGSRHMLSTTDGFATWKATSLNLPGWVGACGWDQNSGRVVWIPGTKTAWVIVKASSCGNPPSVRSVTTDGGATWGDWEPSPASAAGFLAFGDADTGFRLEVRDLAVTHDGGKTFRSTGPAPRQDGSASGYRLTVVDAEHAWVTSTTERSCEPGPYSYIAAWNK
jgi:hypothetical protein